MHSAAAVSSPSQPQKIDWTPEEKKYIHKIAGNLDTIVAFAEGKDTQRIILRLSHEEPLTKTVWLKVHKLAPDTDFAEFCKKHCSLSYAINFRQIILLRSVAQECY